MSGKEQNGKKKRGMRPLEIKISIKTKKKGKHQLEENGNICRLVCGIAFSF